MASNKDWMFVPIWERLAQHEGIKRRGAPLRQRQVENHRSRTHLLQGDQTVGKRVTRPGPGARESRCPVVKIDQKDLGSRRG